MVGVGFESSVQGIVASSWATLVDFQVCCVMVVCGGCLARGKLYAHRLPLSLFDLSLKQVHNAALLWCRLMLCDP